MKDQEIQQSSAILNRRSFVKTSAVAGALVASNTRPVNAQTTPPSKVINVALIGCGAQGEKLIESIIGKGRVEGINFVAVCDIWKFNLEHKAKLIASLQARNNDTGMRDEYAKIGRYFDYVKMIEDEKDRIDVVLIASPDYMHHVHTRAGLEAGHAVYCEKMMSNTLEGARDMVRAQRETDGILQIGHQRRSNPRYRALRDQLIFGEKAFGRITHAYGQWNRSTISGKVSLPKKTKWLAQDLLEKNGFTADTSLPEDKRHEEQMYRFRNWRFFRKFGGGVVSDLGAHQIDIFNWFFNATPKSLIASGGIDYHMDSELYDNVMSIYEYEPRDADGNVLKHPETGEVMRSRGYYQVLTTTSALGFFERFMGDEGTVSISEIPTTNQAYREANAPPWEPFLAKRLMKKDETEVKYNPWDIPKTWGSKPKPWVKSNKAGQSDSRATKALESWELITELEELPHTPHLRNFFDVVRSGKKEDLNCSVQEAFKSCVTVLKIYEAVESGTKVEFSSEDFVA
ncbi:MAG: putative dehydrogenase [Verrucomicrobiales bacterium]|jgi:predicted dehydrogenase